MEVIYLNLYVVMTLFSDFLYFCLNSEVFQVSVVLCIYLFKERKIKQHLTNSGLGLNVLHGLIISNFQPTFSYFHTLLTSLLPTLLTC